MRSESLQGKNDICPINFLFFKMKMSLALVEVEVPFSSRELNCNGKRSVPVLARAIVVGHKVKLTVSRSE